MTRSKEQDYRLQTLRAEARKQEAVWKNIANKAAGGDVPDEDDVEHLLNNSTFAVMLAVAVTLYETMKDE